MLAIPPAIFTVLAIWQAAFGHPVGNKPMSNAGLVTMAVFLWLVYLRLITVRLETVVRRARIDVRMRGFFRRRHIEADNIKSAKVIAFDPVKDYGGYGIRATRKGLVMLARGTRGVRMELKKGGAATIGSERPEELVAAIRRMG